MTSSFDMQGKTLIRVPNQHPNRIAESMEAYQHLVRQPGHILKKYINISNFN